MQRVDALVASYATTVHETKWKPHVKRESDVAVHIIAVPELCYSDRFPDLIHYMRLCIDDIKDWVTDNKLKLNDGRTEVMIIHPVECPLPYIFPTLLVKL